MPYSIAPLQNAIVRLKKAAVDYEKAAVNALCHRHPDQALMMPSSRSAPGRPAAPSVVPHHIYAPGFTPAMA